MNDDFKVESLSYMINYGTQKNPSSLALFAKRQDLQSQWCSPRYLYSNVETTVRPVGERLLPTSKIFGSQLKFRISSKSRMYSWVFSDVEDGDLRKVTFANA